MSQFISKVQYKTCEKGEYYDEQRRSLEETIELLNNFPWAREQYAHVELTGPSITILDDKGNFLKVGIYFGGRFTLYYLDARNRYYEYYPLKIDAVYALVTDFFNGKINVTAFEKIQFAIAKRGYFISRAFEYRISVWQAALFNNSLNIWLIPLLIILVLELTSGILHHSLTPSFLFMMSFIAVPALCLGHRIESLFLKFSRKKNQYLKISRGNPEFIFGDDANEIKTYNKGDIKEIIHFENKNYKSANGILIIIIVFNDGSSLCFSSMLINYSSLQLKFSDKWKFQRTRIDSNYWEMKEYL